MVRNGAIFPCVEGGKFRGFELSPERKCQLACCIIQGWVGPAFPRPVKSQAGSAQQGFNDLCANMGHGHHHRPRYGPCQQLWPRGHYSPGPKAHHINMTLTAACPPCPGLNMVPAGYGPANVYNNNNMLIVLQKYF